MLFLFFVAFCFCLKKHEPGKRIPLLSDKIWPTSNPSETYSYYRLPFCPPKKRIGQSFAAELSGSSLYETSYKIKFLEDEEKVELCSKEYDADELESFFKGVKKNFFALFSFDDLPIKFPIGRTYENIQTGEIIYKLFTNLNFKIWYNEAYIIEVEAIPSEDNSMIQLKEKMSPMTITFTYSVEWLETAKMKHDRWEKYVNFKLFPEEIEIQWFSIVNSLVLVIVLTTFVAFVMSRILLRDYAYYDDEDASPGEETGWKLLHGEIFRPPKHVNILSAILGNGVQLLSAILLLLVLSVLGVFYPGYSNKTLYAALVVLWILSSGFSGYISAKYYKQFGGTKWVRNVLLTTILFVGPCFLTWCVLNTIAIFYRSSAAFSFKLVAGLVGVYCVFSFPLQLLGAITAKNFASDFNAPCRTKPFVREVPPAPWYKNGMVQMTIAGFLPFSSIYIELYYFYLSIWGYIFFSPYIVLLIFFVILLIVTSCITIAMTYIQISQEDHRWWWRAVFCGGASAFFIFGYSIFYYYVESPMKGFFQFVFYFGYNLMICFAFFLMFSTVGFLSSLVFIKRIYRGIRVD